MSGDLLSEDQIAKLFDQASRGTLATDVKVPGRRARGLRTVDFQHPTKFTAEQERRIKRGIDTFCRTATRRLAAQLRIDVELEAIDVMQLTWFNAHAQIPYDSICGLIEAGDAKLLLSAEQSLTIHFVERLLGGTQPSADRKLTEIDLVLARRFFLALIEELSTVWVDMTSIELSFGGLATQPESANLARASEPTLAVVLEGRLDRSSSTVVLLIPYSAAAPLEHAHADDAIVHDAHTAAAVDAALREVSVPLRAEVASTTMSLDDVLALRPGDTVTFNASVEQGVTLYADKVAVHAARPGRAGRRRAVQVVGPAPEDA